MVKTLHQDDEEYQNIFWSYNYLPQVPYPDEMSGRDVPDPKPYEIALPRNHNECVQLIRKYYNSSPMIYPRIKSGGGHHFCAWNTEHDGHTIDLRHLKSFKFNKKTEEITVGPGWQWAELYYEITDNKSMQKEAGKDRYGNKLVYALPGGSCVSVGMCGYTLGGGHSPFSRSFGLGCDRVTKFTAILADGKTVKVEPNGKYSDLYYTLGSGGNAFYLVTDMTYKLGKIPFKFPFGVWIMDINIPKVIPDDYPKYMQDLKRVTLLIDQWAKVMPTLPENLAIYFLYAGSRFFFFYAYNKGDHDTGVAIMDGFIQRCNQVCSGAGVSMEGRWDSRRAHLFDTIIEYEELCREFFDNSHISRTKLVMSSGMYTGVSTDAVGYLMQKYQVLWGTPLGGNVIKGNKGKNAASFRDAEYCLIMFIFDPSESVVRANNESLDTFNQMQGDKFLGMYINYPDPYITGSYFDNYFEKDILERLQTIKLKYDPYNFFKNPMSVTGCNAMSEQEKESLGAAGDSLRRMFNEMLEQSGINFTYLEQGIPIGILLPDFKLNGKYNNRNLTYTITSNLMKGKYVLQLDNKRELKDIKDHVNLMNKNFEGYQKCLTEAPTTVKPGLPGPPVVGNQFGMVFNGPDTYMGIRNDPYLSDPNINDPGLPYHLPSERVIAVLESMNGGSMILNKPVPTESVFYIYAAFGVPFLKLPQQDFQNTPPQDLDYEAIGALVTYLSGGSNLVECQNGQSTNSVGFPCIDWERKGFYIGWFKNVM